MEQSQPRRGRAASMQQIPLNTRPQAVTLHRHTRDKKKKKSTCSMHTRWTLHTDLLNCITRSDKLNVLCNMFLFWDYLGNRLTLLENPPKVEIIQIKRGDRLSYCPCSAPESCAITTRSFSNSTLKPHEFLPGIPLPLFRSVAVFVCVWLIPERSEHRRIRCARSQTMCDNITAGCANRTEPSVNFGQKCSLRECLPCFSVGAERWICRIFG